MNVTQCRMARAALKWSLDDLAKASKVGRASVARFEAGESLKPETVATMRSAFESKGVIFTNGGKLTGVSVLTPLCW